MLVQNSVTLFKDTEIFMTNAFYKFGDFISSNRIFMKNACSILGDFISRYPIFNGKCLFKIRLLYLKTPNFLWAMLVQNLVTLFQVTEIFMTNAFYKFVDFISSNRIFNGKSLFKIR
jgi:uncharacterized protein (DUF486 family)